MFESIIGPLISAGSSLLGGLFGQSSKDKDREAQERMAQQNIALQKEFAQTGIRWKVADAKAAGIHPLYALGANTTSFSPVSVGSDPSSPMGEAVGKMGQDISRAVTATSSKEERALQLTGTKLQLENQQLQNEILKAKLASDVAKVSQQSAPPFPTMTFNPFSGTTGADVKVEQDTRQKLTPFGLRWMLANTPDAQTFENRYAEGPLSWLYGAGNLIGDANANYKHYIHNPYVAPYAKRWMNWYTSQIMKPDRFSNWYEKHNTIGY